MRVAVYTDYVYSRDAGGIAGERAFVVFLAGLRDHVESLTIVGRLDSKHRAGAYRLPPDVHFVGLPHYESLTTPHLALLAMLRSLRRFWRLLGTVDAVWLLGPYVHSLAFALLAACRSTPVVLGVRQDLPRYTRTRHPRKPHLHLAALVLDLVWRRLAKRYPIAVVGPDLAERYRGACSLLEMQVSLVSRDELVSPAAAADRSWDGEIRLLTVGRLDREKNPLLLADILARLAADDPRWKLVVCGDGPMRPLLEGRLRELGVLDHAELLGYVPRGGGLEEVYRSSHAFLHVSWTEGVPQVLFEAWAAGLPVVATSVGGVARASAGATLLVPPGVVDAPVAHLRRLAAEPALRRALVEAGLSRVSAATMEEEISRLVRWIDASVRTSRDGSRVRRASIRRPTASTVTGGRQPGGGI